MVTSTQDQSTMKAKRAERASQRSAVTALNMENSAITNRTDLVSYCAIFNTLCAVFRKDNNGYIEMYEMKDHKPNGRYTDYQ